MMFVAIFLPFLSPVLSAAADIYVSSSDGINNTSCWTGGVQTPCATLDLAIQGASASARSTAVQIRGGGGNESGIVIYLLPGTYTATVLEQQLISSNVSIISMRNENEISINVNECDTLIDDCLSLNVTFMDLSLLCPSSYSFNDSCICDYLKFTANVTDQCTGEVFDWKNELKVCINDSTSTDPLCTNEAIKPKYNKYYIEQNCGLNTCDVFGQINDQSDESVPELYYKLSSFCYDNIIGTGPHTITLSISTIGLTTVSTSITVNITSECREFLNTVNGECELYPNCSSDQEYCPYAISCNDYCDHYDKSCLDSTCRSNESRLCASCPSGNGVPINKIKKCVSCRHYLSSILVFIGIEVLPVTFIVLLIIAFNIQLTNGSISGLVFYSQIVFVIFSDYVFYYSSDANYQINYLIASPCNVFNLDFTPFLGNYSLCIAPHMSPLGAISFWYVVGFYPLLLLLLLYAWITLYDKGYKCVVLVTRPFHRCMARFWSMTGIEPSFTHSIASIYILCFTQLTATSFKILRFQSSWYFDGDPWLFFYDAKQPYFEAIHILASIFAILVLLVFILLPTLYLLLYPFKWFHKLLDCLHLRKQLLISLSDVFTGPYKNGTDGTYDYRFFAGFYLLLRVLIVSLQFGIFQSLFLSFFISSTLQCCLVSLLALTVFIFRPFQRNVHNFCEVLVLAFVISIFVLFIYATNQSSYNEYYGEDFYIPSGVATASFNGLLFFVLLIYVIVQLYKINNNCYKYHKLHNRTIRVQEPEDQPLVGNDDDWIADRMENPQEYDEQHVPVRLDDLSVEYDPQDNTVAANYGSINNNKTVNFK